MIEDTRIYVLGGNLDEAEIYGREAGFNDRPDGNRRVHLLTSPWSLRGCRHSELHLVGRYYDNPMYSLEFREEVDIRVKLGHLKVVVVGDDND